MIEAYPGADLRLLPEAGRPDRHTKTLLIWHSIVGTAEGAYGYFLNRTSIESTLILKLTGEFIQCMNLSDRADANRRVNSIAVSVETEDDGDPDNFPWTAAQEDAIVDSSVWFVRESGAKIPPRLSPGPYEGGVGWHVMHGAPSPWTSYVKTCPGRVRVRQFKRRVWPRIEAALNDSPRPEVPEMRIDEVQKFAQGRDPDSGETVGPVWLLNAEDLTKEGIEDHAAREGYAELFRISPEVHFVHPSVIAQFRERGES